MDMLARRGAGLSRMLVSVVMLTEEFNFGEGVVLISETIPRLTSCLIIYLWAASCRGEALNGKGGLGSDVEIASSSGR
jgi:hypothetical protein